MLKTICLTFLVIFISFGNPCAEESSPADINQETEGVEKDLQKLKVEWNALQNERRVYVENVQDVGTRWAKTTGKMYLKTRHREIAESELRGKEDDVYWEWRAKQKGFIPNISREKWKETPEAQWLLEKHDRIRSKLNSDYIRDVNELDKVGFKGDDGSLQAMDQRQKELLDQYRLARERLEKLRLRQDSPSSQDTPHSGTPVSETPMTLQPSGDNLKKVLKQAQGCLNQSQGAKATITAYLSQVNALLQKSNALSGKIKPLLSRFEWLSEKKGLMQTRIQNAQNLGASIQGSGLSTDHVTRLYDQARGARQGACDALREVRGVGPDLDAVVQRATQFADQAKRIGAQARGIGANAQNYAVGVEAQLGKIRSIKQDWDSFQQEIANFGSLTTELEGEYHEIYASFAAVAPGLSAYESAISQIEQCKNIILGGLSPYSNSSQQAQALVGQINSLAASYAGANASGLLQQAQGQIKMAYGQMTQVKTLVSSGPRDFPVDLSGLEDKVRDIRATAETVDFFESKINAEIQDAQSCADKVGQIVQHLRQPPPGWTPVGESVAGPSTPGKESQGASFKSATEIIVELQKPPPTPPPTVPPHGPTGPIGPRQPPSQSTEDSTTWTPPVSPTTIGGGSEHPGQSSGGGEASDLQ